MSAITVGFDFGTHQTKICLENAENPALPVYEFFEFPMPDGSRNVLFPSIVQINQDNTLSYGFVDESKCKEKVIEIPPEPVFNGGDEPVYAAPEEVKLDSIIFKPKLILPNRPKLPKKVRPDSPRYIQMISAWEKECDRLKKDYKTKKEAWLKLATLYKHQHEESYIESQKALRAEFENKHALWQQSHDDYVRTHAQWSKIARQEKKYSFRYFKQASLFNNVEWNHPDVNPDVICVLYLTHIVLLLKDRFHEQLYMQVGTPSDGTEHDKYVRNKVECLYAAAVILSRHFNTTADYNAMRYDQLLQLVSIPAQVSTEELDKDYWVSAFPEAFAGLRAVTAMGRLTSGIHIIADIGGGTTDVAVFSVNKEKPNIHKMVSFHKGLNFILEKVHQETNRPMKELQRHFLEEPDDEIFSAAITDYIRDLIRNCGNLIMEMTEVFRSGGRQNLIYKFKDALKGDALVYSGGGSMYDELCVPIAYFTEIVNIDKDLLNIQHVVNRDIPDKLYPILSTSYGLSIPYFDPIDFTPLERIFDKIQEVPDDSAGQRYEHGLSDFS